MQNDLEMTQKIPQDISTFRKAILKSWAIYKLWILENTQKKKLGINIYKLKQDQGPLFLCNIANHSNALIRVWEFQAEFLKLLASMLIDVIPSMPFQTR